MRGWHEEREAGRLIGSWMCGLLILPAIFSLLFVPPGGAQELGRFVLDNGLVVIVESSVESKTEAFELFIRVGVADEPPEANGITNLVQHVLLKSTETRDATAIANAIEDVGGVLDAEAETDVARVSCLVTADVYQIGLEILADVVARPTFPEEEIEKEKAAIVAEIGAQEDQSFSFAYHRLRRAMYGGHPYGRSPVGTVSCVSRLTREDVLDHYRRYYRAPNMVLSVAGGIPVAEMREAIEREFASLSGDEVERLPSSAVVWPERGGERTYDREILQSYILIGYPGARITSEDYVPLKVLDAVLSGGMSSRLFVNVRDRKGLAYDVGSFIPTRRDPAPFVIYLGTNPATARQAVAALEHETERVREEPVPDEEVERSKRYLSGRWRAEHQRSSDRAYYRGWFEVLGIGYEFDNRYPLLIETVTWEDLAEAAQTYLKNPTLVMLKPIGMETDW